MKDWHISVEFLRAIQRHEGASSDLVGIAMAHLTEQCPACRQAFESWRGEVDLEVTGYDLAFDRVRARLRGELEPGCSSADLVGTVTAEKHAAREQLAELLALPQDKRPSKIASERSRFTGPLLGELLLDEASKRVSTAPQDSYSLARLAQTVVQHGETSLFATDVYARALAHQGNAFRVQGELRRAGELIDVARFLFRAQGASDRLVRAELDKHEGRLRRAQRRYDEAERLLTRAIVTYGLEGQPLEAAKVVLSLAMTLEQIGKLDRAIELVEEAMEEFQERGNESLLLMAKHNFIFYAVKLGQVSRARELFEEAAPLYDRFADPLLQIRRIWLDANLSRAEGNFELAEHGYRVVRDRFVDCGIGYDAALVSLDLATLYAERGQTSEIKRIAGEIVPIFEAQDVHREAAAALMLFQDAVRAEQVTLRYILELSRYLERARLDPSLAFQVPT